MKINLYFISFLAVFLARNIIETRIKPKTSKVAQGKATLAVFVLSYLVSAITVLVLLWKEPPINPLSFLIGLVLLIYGFGWRVLSIRQFWHSYNQGLVPSGQLVTTGIYSKIRHPLYFFYTLEMLALVIMKFNIISVGALIATLIAAVIRMQQEEASLLEIFGADYESYRSKTRKFIPYLY